MPKIYVLPTESPNAFCHGTESHMLRWRLHTDSQLLMTEELEGVLAHELGMWRNRDI